MCILGFSQLVLKSKFTNFTNKNSHVIREYNTNMNGIRLYYYNVKPDHVILF